MMLSMGMNTKETKIQQSSPQDRLEIREMQLAFLGDSAFHNRKPELCECPNQYPHESTSAWHDQTCFFGRQLARFRLPLNAYSGQNACTGQAK